MMAAGRMSTNRSCRLEFEMKARVLVFVMRRTDHSWSHHTMSEMKGPMQVYAFTVLTLDALRCEKERATYPSSEATISCPRSVRVGIDGSTSACVSWGSTTRHAT